MHADVQKNRNSSERKPPSLPQSFSLELLKKIYFKRLEKNPTYSLRAFSRLIGISHPLLSMLFSGKKRLTQETAKRIADKLDLPPMKRRLFFREFEADKKEEVKESDELNHIDLDTFSLISEWQHFAILSLLETKDFKMDPQWIGSRLGISPLLVKNSIERLRRMKLIEKVNGAWTQTGGYIRHNNQKSTSATRKYQIQTMKKAVESLTKDPFEVRNMSTITFATDPRNVTYAIQKIKDFRISLSNELENMGTKEEVYNLSIQLYPVTKR